MSLTFSVFADLHYKKGMYAVTVQDLEQILDRANANSVDFVIHAGDFCNDYKGSPEIVNTYLKNKYNLATYGVHGNHELESADNSMEYVTSLLTNDESVVWGTADGKIGDGTIGYYYFDKNGYRIIGLDSNYSYNDVLQAWEHNKTASWGAPSGNKLANSLGPVQLKWLEELLMKSAEEKISCIVFSHASLTDLWYPSPDTENVQSLFKKANNITPGTVIMCLNGHYHTNHIGVKDNILYFDVNTVINGSWVPKKEHHYTEEHKFILENYDSEGLYRSSKEIALTELWQSVNTHYFNEPLSAIVTINDDGTIEISGSKTSWKYDVIPVSDNPAIMPEISSERFKSCLKGGISNEI